MDIKSCYKSNDSDGYTIEFDNLVCISIMNMPYCCGVSIIYGLSIPYELKYDGSSGHHDDDDYSVSGLLKELHYFLTDGERWAEYDDWDEESDVNYMDSIANILNRCKLVVFDAVGGENGQESGSLWRMATENRWSQMGDSTHNPNSGNLVTTYEWINEEVVETN